MKNSFLLRGTKKLTILLLILFGCSKDANMPMAQTKVLVVMLTRVRVIMCRQMQG